MAVITLVVFPFKPGDQLQLQKTALSNVYLVESRPQSLQCIPLAKGRDVLVSVLGDGGTIESAETG